MLYTYINRHAGTPDKTKTKDTMSLDYNLLHWVYDRTGVDEGNLQMIIENFPIHTSYGTSILTSSNYDVEIK